MCVYLLALLAGLQINTLKSPGFLCPASEAVMNSEDSADWTSDPEKRPLKRNECCHYVISVAVNKWNVECGKKNAIPLSAFNIWFSWTTSILRRSGRRALFQNEVSTIWKKWWHLRWKQDWWQKLKNKERRKLSDFLMDSLLNTLAECNFCRLVWLQKDVTMWFVKTKRHIRPQNLNKLYDHFQQILSFKGLGYINCIST